MFDITFLLGGSAVAVLLVQILKSAFEGVSKRWGALIAQATLLVVAFGIAGLGVLFQKLPPEILKTTLVVFGTAMTIYEVFVKAIFKKAIKGE